jgi:hypothetical protein
MPFPVISLSALVAFNLVPLAGALLLGWRVVDILLLFWLENVVIGVFNVLRMGLRVVSFREWEGLILIPFFIFHFGIFCAAHGAILMGFAVGTQMGSDLAMGASGVVTIVRELLTQSGMVWGLAGMVLSHGVSFVLNFLIGGELRRTDVRTLMGQPYARVMILHVVIIFGAIAVLQLGQPVWALALLVAVKIAVDVTAHLAERRKLASARNRVEPVSTSAS